MEPSTAIPDATSGNTVSNAMMLSLRPHQLHWNRLTPSFLDLCHSLPQPFNEHHTSVAPVTPEPNPAVPVSTPTAMPKVTPVPTPTSTPGVVPVQP